jgi:dihydrolipoamide dehydrogenase
MTKIVLKKLSGEDKSAKVGKIVIKPGHKINPGDVLFNAESIKGNFPVKSQHEGTIQKVHIQEGQTVNIGDVLAEIDGIVCEKADDITTKSQKPSINYHFGISKPKKEDLICDIAVIGGGPGGYVAAIRGAQLGASVILIEKDKIGGTCLNYGCIPTKTLVKSAHLLDEIRRSREFGIETEPAIVNLEKVIQRKEQVVSNLSKGIEYLMDRRNVRVIYGEATWNNGKIHVNNNKVDAVIDAKNTILATGSSPAKLPIPGTDLPCVITSQEALEIRQIPKSMTIIGGGIIGMEFAFIFNSFGAEVTVIEFLDDILFNFDNDVIEIIKSECRERGIKLYTGARAQEITVSEDGLGITTFEDAKGKHFAIGDIVLMAVGRKPNLNAIDLAAMDVALNEKGNGIKIDLQMRTSNPSVFAVGDVTNQIQLAHVASHQGIVAVEASMGHNSKIDYSAVPSAVFLSPEIGTIGLNEKEAQRIGIDYCVSKFPFSANGKALTQGEIVGFVKLIASNKDHRILGASIIGPGASDLIANLTYFIQNKTDYRTIKDTVFAHPTTAESIHEAILGIESEAIHFV